MDNLIVLNSDFVTIGVVDIYESLMWQRRFYTSGFFSLQAPATENNLALLKEGNYLVRAGSIESAIIKYINIVDSGSEKVIITAEGYFLSYLLNGHIVNQSVTVSGNAETAMRSLVERTVMNEDSDDYIPFIRLGDISGAAAKVSTVIKYKDLLEALSELSKLSGVGFRLRADLNEGVVYFECYEGRDLSVGQESNPQMIFSPEYDTILSNPTYTFDDTVTVNSVFAYYSGSLGTVVVEYNPSFLKGTEKKTVAIQGEAVTYTTAEGAVRLDSSGTAARLTALAKEKITERAESFSCSVSFTGNSEYKKSYDIGDIVTTEYPDWDISVNQRIHTVTEIYDSSGTEIIPEMGEIWPSGKE